MNTNAQKTDLPPAIFLMGPTAAGKTALALALCDHLPVEIISVDSALVYRGMDIGTAKPSAEEQHKAPHRLIDIKDPSEPYSAAEFRRDALREMADISAKGRIPLLVGGTMLYFKVLLEGLADLPEANPLVRERIQREAEQFGWPHMHGQLEKIDPEYAKVIHPHHSQRISRALEVFHESGKTMSQLRHEQTLLEGTPLLNDYNVTQLAVAPQDRRILHERIAARFNGMIETGFLREVQSLYDRKDLHIDLPAIKSVGYRQAWQYLAGEISYEEMVEKGIVATRQLAKRQLTWLRSWQNINWVYTHSKEGKELKINEIVAQALNFMSITAI